MLKKLLFSAGSAFALLPVHAAVQDAYGPLTQWRQGSGFEVTPIHVALLPTGDLFFINEFNLFFYPGLDLTAPGFKPEFSFLMRPTPATEVPPASVVIQPLAAPPALHPSFDSTYARFKSTVCSGHSFLANGDLFFASGAEGIIDRARYDSGDLVGSLAVDGIAESFTFHIATQGWTQNPGTIIPGTATGRPLRWYASVTRLADSRMLVAGGYERVLPLPLIFNPSVEVFDPRTNAWSAVSGTLETPAGMESPDYTHIFQFPNAQRPDTVLVIGGSGEPMYLSLKGQAPLWHRTGSYRPGAKAYIEASAPQKVFPNKGSSSALLPLRLPEGNWGYSNGSVLYAGGAHGTPGNGNVDIYDAGSDIWRPSIPMHGLRHHPSTVLLPDGRVLILAGFDDMSGMPQTGFAEYVDPRNNFALSQGTAEMPEVRGYHTVTVLLPDGRVLLGSGNIDGNDGREHDNFRYYFPDYMTKARPAIASAPESFSVGSHAFISVPHKTTVGEAALVGLGSQTHSFDLNQRHIQLRTFDLAITARLVAGQWVIASAAECAASAEPCYDWHAIQAPASPETAPPGPYMLFILDGARVPSTAKMIRLDSSQGIVAAPGWLDFGSQPLRTSSSQQVMVSNTGSAPVAGIAISVGAPFSVTHDCTTLAAGASCQATVAFTPTAAGGVAANVAILGAGGASFQVPVIGVSERSSAASLAVATDLNGDGRSDVLYRNSTTGQVYRLLMDGTTITSGAGAYSEPDTTWRIVADADFTADGVTDLLWRNDSSGQLFLMPFGPTGFPQPGSVIATEPRAEWKVVHAPDLDGDGFADLLWWNSQTGQVYAMLMGAAGIGAQGLVYTEPNTQWTIAAAGDFAGTGKANQIIWRNAQTGQVYLMTIAVSGGAFTQSGTMIYQEPNTQWDVIGAADFDGDGKSDLLWKNFATGQVYMMLMNGASIASQGMVYTEPNLNWNIVSTGDYDGDGKSDLLWRNEATGEVYVMRMNGLAMASGTLIYREPDTAWRVLGPWEYF